MWAIAGLYLLRALIYWMATLSFKPVQLSLTPTRHRRLNELVGLLLLATALLLLLALLSYHPSDSSLNTVAPRGAVIGNWAGVFGAWIADLLLQLEGIAAFVLPVFLAALGWSWLRSRATGSPYSRLTGLALLLLFAPALAGLLPRSMHFRSSIPIAGLTGRLVVDALVACLNFPGACLIILTFCGVAVYLSTAFSFEEARLWLVARMGFVRTWRTSLTTWKEERERRQQDKAEQRALRAARKNAERQARRNNGIPDGPVPAPPPAGPLTELVAEDPEVTPTLWDDIPRAVVSDPEPEPIPVAERITARPVRTTAPEPPVQAVYQEPEEDEIAEEDDFDAIEIAERADAELRTKVVKPRQVSGFKLPPSSLLSQAEEPVIVRQDALREEAQVLVEKCAEFDVRGQVTQINPGPMVTTFEFKPEPGVKYSRVTGLADDLCLAMRAESILIERMAGKSTVGIQVPNEEKETIWLRDVIESETFSTAKSKLTFAMGKDINGRIATADLATMPHVLIAGSTGSGKSVAINAVIMSLLYRMTPEQVRLILVDPKRVELGMYEGIPHLFTPIITEPKLAANALRNAVREMERRLKLLASRSVRNIDQYNKRFETELPTLFENGEEEKPLPYIVIIIDELADLMMLDKSNVEESITRLAQMARAVGIHLVLATQRPSVDVITGLIKANVPTRISFRLATKVDSRTILDSNGAESLLGRGDMLFLPPGTSRLVRLHAPFVTEKETAAVVQFWKEQGEAEYVQGFLDSPKDEKGRDLDAAGADGEDSDELYEDGVRLVFEFGKASTSLLQRRLRIGYGRAAHIIDMMERDGLVGPADGSKPREILKSANWVKEVEESMR